ncbi:MAG TPA: hypothetical protein VJ756_12100 [Terriglobales bacterium]|nr:hypothetical protein [Terriglobales bacterium]
MDTRMVVWLAFDPAQLPSIARAAIEHAGQKEDGLVVSDITLLQLTNLVSKDRIRLDNSLESFFQEIGMRFAVLPITNRAVYCL